MLERFGNLFEREAGHILVGLIFALYGALFAQYVDRATGINMAWAAFGWIGRSMGATMSAAPPQITK